MTQGQSLYREPDGNVVIRSDNVALRFFHQYGGTPLEWWSEPFPLLTNPFPGSAASIYHEVGQDPTQATSDGLTRNHIARNGNGDSIYKYNYFARETLFNPAVSPSYEVTLFPPDFWLSHEPADDWFPTDNPDGWVTKYQPQNYTPLFSTEPTSIYFHGTSTKSIGFITPGNEIVCNNTFQDLRNYPDGRFAARFNISFYYAPNKPAEGGVVFRKQFLANFPNSTSPNNLSTQQVYSAHGYHFVVTYDGKWKFQKIQPNLTNSHSGKLTSQERTLLKSPNGLELQIRTHNSIPGYMECYVNNRLVYVTNDPLPLLGNHAFLYANTTELVKFSQRRFHDVSIQSTVLYTAMPNATIRSTHSWMKAPGAEATPQALYRAGLTIFLNQTTFPTNFRTTLGINPQGPISHPNVDINNQLVKFSDYESYWIGNDQGTIGLKATIVQAQLNNQLSPNAHLLMQQHSFNDEFILGLNILPPQSSAPSPVPFTSGKLIIDWQTKI